MGLIGTKHVSIQLIMLPAAQLANSNPVLLTGEIAIESDTLKWKAGNGVSHYSDLSYGVGVPVVPEYIVPGDGRLSYLPDGTTLVLQWDQALINKFGTQERPAYYFRSDNDGVSFKWNTSIQPNYQNNGLKVTSIQFENVGDASFKILIK